MDEYIKSGDADQLVERTFLTRTRPRGPLGRVRRLLVGDRGHLRMYDSASAVALLHSAGFVDARAMPVGETNIVNPGSLDLEERSDESIYLEARAPNNR